MQAGPKSCGSTGSPPESLPFRDAGRGGPLAGTALLLLSLLGVCSCEGGKRTDRTTLWAQDAYSRVSALQLLEQARRLLAERGAGPGPYELAEVEASNLDREGTIDLTRFDPHHPTTLAYRFTDGSHGYEVLYTPDPKGGPPIVVVGHLPRAPAPLPPGGALPDSPELFARLASPERLEGARIHYGCHDGRARVAIVGPRGETPPPTDLPQEDEGTEGR